MQYLSPFTGADSNLHFLRSFSNFISYHFLEIIIPHGVIHSQVYMVVTVFKLIGSTLKIR